MYSALILPEILLRTWKVSLLDLSTSIRICILQLGGPVSDNLYYLYLCLYLHLCFARAAQYLVSSLWILRSDCGLEQSQEIAGGILQLHSEPHPPVSEIPSGLWKIPPTFNWNNQSLLALHAFFLQNQGCAYILYKL